LLSIVTNFSKDASVIFKSFEITEPPPDYGTLGVTVIVSGEMAGAVT
jgi:hypothetical protein